MTPCSLVGVCVHSGGMFPAASLRKMDAVCSYGASVPTYLQGTFTSRPLTQNDAVIAHFSDMSEPYHWD